MSMRLSFQICKMTETIVQTTKERRLNEVMASKCWAKRCYDDRSGKEAHFWALEIAESPWVVILPPPGKVMVKVKSDDRGTEVSCARQMKNSQTAMLWLASLLLYIFFNSIGTKTIERLLCARPCGVRTMAPVALHSGNSLPFSWCGRGKLAWEMEINK